MSIVVTFEDPHDVSHIVEVLTDSALTHAREHRSLMARRDLRVADALGDALERSAAPPCNRPHVH